VPTKPEPAADAVEPGTSADDTRASRKFWVIVAIALAVVAADQLSKWWAETNLSDGQVIPVIGDFIRFELVYNPGAAFGLGQGFTWVLAILAVVVAVAIAWYAWRVRSGLWALVLGLVLGGAITHSGDRLFREPGFLQGHVVDFIGYGDWFIGNVADIAIVGGAILGAVLAIFGVKMLRDPSKKELAAAKLEADREEAFAHDDDDDAAEEAASAKG
jgi:signal peptidase II